MTRPERLLRIALYAPLKAPGHPVPSGDRLMSQLLVASLQAAGHQVEVISELRAFLGDAQDHAGWARLQAAAGAEAARIADRWARTGAPDVWLCYHPYYKAPDLMGPDLSRRFGLAYVTVEASYSRRRNIGIWAEMQALVRAAVAGARLNLCVTARDAQGLAEELPQARMARFPAFIETAAFACAAQPAPGHLVTVAMMRPGDKAQSYERLAAWTALLPAKLDWHLSVIGDGPFCPQVRAMFAHLPPGRVHWLGQQDRPRIAAVLATATAYVWPGCGEAYGLAYLEAQAAGVPVVAQAVAGVPEVVADGITGFLTAEGDDAAAAAAITRLVTDAGVQRRMGQAARARVLRDHSLAGASARLDHLLQEALKDQP